MPLDVIYIVIRLFKRVQRMDGIMRSRWLRAALCSPELDGPIHRAGEEQIRKVHWAGEWVEVYPGDRSSMTLVYIVVIEPRFGPSAVVSIGLVDVALLCADPERRRLIVREVQAGDRYLVSLVVTCVNQLECFLRLGQHVYKPAANHSVCTACDKVVGVLSTDHLHRVYRVCMSSRGQGRFENREVLRSCIPEKNLPGVCATEDKIRVEGGENY